MGTPHKHRDVIIAWANGEECEFFSPITEKWGTLNPNAVPAFYEDYEYRIKSKRVKKEGWMFIWEQGCQSAIYETKEQAEQWFNEAQGQVAKVTWEEEECTA